MHLDADELTFAADGALTLHLAHLADRTSGAGNWLPAPDGQFALLLRAYVPTAPLLDGSYTLPDVQRL